MTPERWHQVDRLLQAALDLAPEQRSAFLERACAGDSALRGEIETLLASDERAGSFMEKPAIEVDARVIAGGDGASLDGREVGHYRIVRQLGTGGMGEVYLASDTRTGRKVALKLLPDRFTTEAQRVRRFRQEAQTVLALNHPNIVTVYEIGEANATHFIASELIEGETLRARLARGEMSLPEVLEIATQVAAALSAAHAAGVVHRDIKPENIMLRPDGYVKVLDFGLAKLTEKTAPSQPADSAAATQVLVSTDAGTVMGTINYMSPEQARGREVDARTDIWSLGVVFYEMIAGRLPFERETKGDVLAAILHTEPPVLTRYAPGVPAEIERIVTKALRKDKEERYQASKELGLDLKSLKGRLQFEAELERTGALERSHEAGRTAQDNDNRSTSGTTPAATASVAGAQTGGANEIPLTSSAEYRAGEVKRNGRGMAAGLTVLLLAAISVGLWLFFSRSSDVTPIESIAVLPFANESGNSDVEYLSDGMTESLINSLSQLPKLAVKARSTVFRYKGKAVEPRQVGSELNVQAILNGRVVQRGDDLTLYLSLVDAGSGNQLWGEQYNRKLTDLVSLQGEIARDVSQKLRARLSGADARRVAKSYTENAEAYRLYLRGRFEWNKFTPDGIQKSIDYYNQAIASDPLYALAYVGLADSYRLQTHSGHVPPKESYARAKWASEKALSLDDTLSEAHYATGVIKLFYEWDRAGAERELKRAIELNPNSAAGYNAYSGYLKALGRYDEALAVAKRAQELDPLSPIISMEIAEPLLFTGRYDEAIAQGRKTLEIDPHFFLAHNVIARAYEQKGMYAEAVTEFEKIGEVMGRESIVVAALGHSFAMAGERDRARKTLDELRDMSTRRYVPSYWVAMIYAGLGDKEQAIKELEKSYDERYFLMIWLKGEPRFANLRSDPRFQNLLRRVGFAP